MEKTIHLWTIEDLNQRFTEINFPEYQREPNIWELAAKQRLIDSVLRGFDIASLYFYQDSDSSLDCIDGRQRINAITSFLANNPNDEDDGFPLRLSNEIYEEDHQFESLDGQSWASLVELAQSQGATSTLAAQAVDRLQAYEVTAVLLSDVGRPEEFNLQFTRLNLGMTINAGEKLHAMIGDMRDTCFDEPNIGGHPFLDRVSIPTRRYAKEQVAAQVLAQVFSLNESGEFTPTRHFDLQRFFKANAVLPPDKQEWVTAVERTFDTLNTTLAGVEALLRNRAVTVSTVVLAWQLRLYEPGGQGPTPDQYAAFITAFLRRLRWQVGKGLDVDDEYRYLIDFQRHVTQASVERRAVEARHGMLQAGFEFWVDQGALQGDTEFTARTGEDPNAESDV